MALTPGLITIGAITASTVQLSATAPQSGTSPFTYQWHRSTSSGFMPGPGNAIAGATKLNFIDSGLVPATQYFYVLVATEDGPSPDVATYVQVGAQTTIQNQSQNQFAQTTYVGVVDQAFANATTPCMVDVTQTSGLVAGQAVKLVDSSGGVPKVVAVESDTDAVFGFVNYDIKSPMFGPGAPVEVSIKSNVIHLYATEAVARGAQLSVDVSSKCGVKALGVSQTYVGWAFDKATAPGALIRVYVESPSYVVGV